MAVIPWQNLSRAPSPGGQRKVAYWHIMWASRTLMLFCQCLTSYMAAWWHHCIKSIVNLKGRLQHCRLSHLKKSNSNYLKLDTFFLWLHKVSLWAGWSSCPPPKAKALWTIIHKWKVDLPEWWGNEVTTWAVKLNCPLRLSWGSAKFCASPGLS